MRCIICNEKFPFAVRRKTCGKLKCKKALLKTEKYMAYQREYQRAYYRRKNATK